MFKGTGSWICAALVRDDNVESLKYQSLINKAFLPLSINIPNRKIIDKIFPVWDRTSLLDQTCAVRITRMRKIIDNLSPILLAAAAMFVMISGFVNLKQSTSRDYQAPTNDKVRKISDEPRAIGATKKIERLNGQYDSDFAFKFPIQTYQPQGRTK